jgi:hypothetical protein
LSQRDVKPLPPLKQRWAGSAGQGLAREAVLRLLTGSQLDSLAFGEHRGRTDLRGLWLASPRGPARPGAGRRSGRCAGCLRRHMVEPGHVGVDVPPGLGVVSSGQFGLRPRGLAGMAGEQIGAAGLLICRRRPARRQLRLWQRRAAPRSGGTASDHLFALRFRQDQDRAVRPLGTSRFRAEASAQVSGMPTRETGR